MSLSPLATALIVPPVNLLLVGIAGVIVARCRLRSGLVLAGIGLLGLLVLALPITADSLIHSLEAGLPLGRARGPPKAIIILSGDVTEVAGTTVTTEVGQLTLERLRAGAALYRRSKLPVLVTGGRPRDGAPPTATLMAESLSQDFGVPVRWTETRSQDTWENARNSAGILVAAGVRSVYLVTHAWHMRRAMMAFAHFGIAVTPASVRLDAPPALKPAEFIPRVSAWVNSYFALHEWIGCAYYALRS